MKKIKLFLGIGILGLLFSICSASFTPIRSFFEVQTVNNTLSLFTPNDFVFSFYSASRAFGFRYNRFNGLDNIVSTINNNSSYTGGNYYSGFLFNSVYYNVQLNNASHNNISFNDYQGWDSVCFDSDSFFIGYGYNGTITVNYDHYLRKPFYGFSTSFLSDSANCLPFNQFGNNLRLFYNDNVNVSNFDLVTLENQSSFTDFESFKDQVVMTTNGNIFLGGYGKRFFPLIGYGYSYIYSTNNGFGYNDWNFATVGSYNLNNYFNGQISVASLAGTSLFTGFAVIPVDYYNSFNNEFLILGKDTNSYDKVLYSLYQCLDSNDNLRYIFRNCTELSHGYIINGSLSVLPYEDSSSPTSEGSDFYKFLFSGDSKTSYIQYSNDTYFFKYFNNNGSQSAVTVALSPNDTAIKLDSLFNVKYGVGNQSGNQSTYSGSISLNDCIDTEICWDYTGSQGNIIRMCTTECVSSGVVASGGYIGSDGTYHFVNSPISIEDSLKTSNPENMFTGSYIDSGGILSLSYFTDYFQPGAKKVGVCPFNYYEGPLDFMTKLKIGDVYLLMPVLCFYSAFQQGKNVSFFDQYDVNDGLFSQPMLYGESYHHKLLFGFFDVLFSIGLLGLIRYLSRHLF